MKHLSTLETQYKTQIDAINKAKAEGDKCFAQDETRLNEFERDIKRQYDTNILTLTTNTERVLDEVIKSYHSQFVRGGSNWRGLYISLPMIKQDMLQSVSDKDLLDAIGNYGFSKGDSFVRMKNQIIADYAKGPLKILADGRKSSSDARNKLSLEKTKFNSDIEKKLKEANEYYQRTKRELRQRILACENIEQSLKEMHLGTRTDVRMPENSCPWVPASMGFKERKGGSYFVYGGVNVHPKVVHVPANTPAGQALLNSAFNNPTKTSTYSAQQIGTLANQYAKINVQREADNARVFAQKQAEARKTSAPPPADQPTGGGSGGMPGGGYSGGPPDRGGSSNDAHNAANALRMRTELTLKQNGILDSSGRLTPEAVAAAKPAMKPETVLSNHSVVAELTKDGSDIKDWSKFTTTSVEMSTGKKIEVHFYQNLKTGEVNYTHIDYKVKGTVPLFYGRPEQEPKSAPFSDKPLSPRWHRR